MRRRGQPQHIQDGRLAVALPAIVQKAAVRLPALAHGGLSALRPMPVDAAVEGVGESADFGFARCVAVKIHRRRQHACQQQRGVDQGQFAVPDPLAAAHVEKVVIETLVSRCIRPAVLRAVPEKLQGGKRAGDSIGARHPAALDADGVARERKADDGNAGWRVFAAGIGDKAIGGIAILQEIAKRRALKTVQQVFIRMGASLSHHRAPQIQA